MEHVTVMFLPDRRRVTVPAGTLLVEAAERAGITLYTACGRQGTCGQCRVSVVGVGDVLACQYAVQQDTDVLVPDGSRQYTHQILQHASEKATAADPAVFKRFVPDARRWEQCRDFLQESTGRPVRICGSLEAAARIPAEPGPVDRSGAGRSGESAGAGLTAVCRDVAADASGPLWLMGVEPGDTTTRSTAGMAVDLGTTTIVARLHDLADGGILATAAEANPQIRYGDDVVSRIGHAENPAGRAELERAVRQCLDALLGRLCAEVGIEREWVYEIVVAGNTTMGHLLAGLPVTSLGQAPYRAHSLAMQDVTAADLGIVAAPGARLVVLPNIAGFVGADTTAVALAVGLEDVTETTLVVDIGTNGELLLKVGDRMFAASCAAGPALEGARIGHGSRAVDGAVQAVEVVDGWLDIDVIGAVAPRSVCGSGLIDAVAVMLETGVLDATGRLVDEPDRLSVLSADIRARRIEFAGQPAFLVAGRIENEDAGRGRDGVVLTQRDIREVQLAKGAIRAGIELLLAEAGIGAGDLEAVLLAGAFGNYIRRSSALRMGLLPPVPPERVRFVGNGSLAGASMCLVNRACRQRAVDLAGRIRYVEIAGRPDFQVAFAEAMLFG